MPSRRGQVKEQIGRNHQGKIDDRDHVDVASWKAIARHVEHNDHTAHAGRGCQHAARFAIRASCEPTDQHRYDQQQKHGQNGSVASNRLQGRSASQPCLPQEEQEHNGRKNIERQHKSRGNLRYAPRRPQSGPQWSCNVQQNADR